MADNSTLPATGQIISTDEITTLNGVAIVTGEKAQRVKVGFGSDGVLRDVDATNVLPTSSRTLDGAGTAITSLGDGGTGMGIGTSDIATNYVVSAAGMNSTTTQLAGGATFTGAVETIFNQQALSILLTIDQPCTLVVKQFIDAAGAREASSISFTIAAGVGFSRALVANGNYYRVLLTNNSGVLTTTLNLNVAQGTLPAVTQTGNGPVSINEIGGTALTAGQKTLANSVPVALASDSGRIGSMQITGGATSQALGLGATATAYGSLRVTEEPNALFTDPFDGGTIDTQRWNAAVVSGMTVTQGTGNMVITTTTVASNSAFIDSLPTFAPLGINFLAFGAAIKLEAQVSSLFALNQRRFWGMGDRPTTFNATTPHKNCYGFEIDVDGILYCCVYQNGTLVYRTSTSLLGATLNSLVTPSNGYCRFGIAMRADTVIFFVNSTEFPAASFSVSSATFGLPDVQALSVRFHAVNTGTGTVGASTFIISSLGLGDTGSNGQNIADGVYPWRRATIKPASTSATSADTHMVVSLHPTTSAPANLAVTATAAANTGVTATLPAPGVGLFHYITGIEIMRTATAALAGTATLVVTTTNLPGSLAWSFGNAMAAGATQRDETLNLATPLKSSVANTATTIVAPIPGAAVLWRINVYYYTAA